MKTIVLMGGSTLGHVIPGISVIRRIRTKYPMVKIVFITVVKQKDLKVIKDLDCEKIFLDIPKLTFKYEVLNFRKWFNYLKELFIKIKPNLVVGFGSYIGSIGILISQKLKIKNIIHEQNKIMGLGNKLSYLKCDKLFLNYELKKKYKKSVIVGNPTLTTYRHKVRDQKKILITSGSNGSKRINEIMIEFINDSISKDYLITLVTGVKYFEEVNKKIKKNDNVTIVPFIHNLSEYMQDFQYVITRSGATTLAEIKELRINPIMIPSTNVRNNHQYYNALEHRKYGIIIKEEELTLESLKRALQEIKLDKYQNAYNEISIKPVDKFIEEMNNVTRLY